MLVRLTGVAKNRDANLNRRNFAGAVAPSNTEISTQMILRILRMYGRCFRSAVGSTVTIRLNSEICY